MSNWMFNPCSPCCTECQICVTMKDPCFGPFAGGTVTIYDRNGGLIATGTTDSSGTACIKVNNNNQYKIDAYGPDYKHNISYTYACANCGFFVPRLFNFTEAATPLSGGFLGSFDDLDSYSMSYGPRPSGVPQQCFAGSTTSTTGGVTTKTTTTVTLPDNSWYSGPIEGSEGTGYIAFGFTNCQAEAIMIVVSDQYETGAYAVVGSKIHYSNILHAALPAPSPLGTMTVQKDVSHPPVVTATTGAIDDVKREAGGIAGYWSTSTSTKVVT